uniref:Helicase ATP-binding domain-containing protein n=1 Tax=Mycena chlorophos TaxID=658473 RepID=A0ABQ0M9J5_MYCCL|nr:predicted protein [Mycena chlorophos]
MASSSNTTSPECDRWKPDCSPHAHDAECYSGQDQLWRMLEAGGDLAVQEAPALLWSWAMRCTAMDLRLRDILLGKGSLAEDLRLRLQYIAGTEDRQALEDLRCLRQYRRPETLSPSASSDLTPSSEFQNLTYVSFRAPFIGDHHKTLLATIDENVREMLRLASPNQSIPLNPSAAFGQASCTGKSRAMAEIASERFAIMFCFREDNESQFAYPPADVELREFLLEPTHQEDSRKRVACFLTELFKHTLVTLHSEEFVKFQQEPENNGVSLATVWYTYFSRQATTTTISPEKVAFNQAVKTATILSENVTRSWMDCERDCVGACSVLIASLVSKQHTTLAHQADLLVLVDEAHTMADRDVVNELGKRTESILQSLERVLRWLVTQSAFFLFLSTHSKLEKMLTPLSKMSSLREQLHYNLFPAITETVGFDLTSSAAIRKLLQDGFSIADVESPDLAVTFGRPVWQAMYATSKDVAPVLTLAFRKMDVNVDKSHHDYHAARDIARIAWASQRVHLSINLSDEGGRNLSQELAQTFMRIVYTIPSDRRYVATIAPSEPILVEAAAQLAARDRTPMAVIVQRLHSNNLVARGERGEIATRLVQLWAHDEVNQLRSGVSNELVPRLAFHRPVPLLEWLQVLLPPEIYAALIASAPVSGPMQSFITAFEGAMMFTSHFVEADDSQVIRIEKLPNFFFRGAAVQCRPGQAQIDSVSPLAWTTGSSLTQRDFGFLDVQTKNRKVENKLYEIPPTVIDPDGICCRPRLTMVFEFGEQKKPAFYIEQRPRRIHHPKEAPSHWQVTLYGLDALQLPSDQKEALLMMLDINAINSEHPRHHIPSNRILRNNLLAGHNEKNMTNWGVPEIWQQLRHPVSANMDVDG